MMSFYEIKVTSTHQKKGLVHNIKCPQVDPEISTFEWNVLQMKANVAKKLRMFLQASQLKVTVLMCFQNMNLARDHG